MTCEHFATGQSAIHKLDPRLKIVLAGLSSIFLVFLHQLTTLVVALLGAIFLLFLARLDSKLLVKRVVILNFFILFISIFLPWTVKGTPLSLPYLPDPSIQGVKMALTLFLKSNAILLLNIGLLSTSTVFALTHAMAHMHFPAKLTHLFFFSWRYLHVLEEELSKMRRAALARGFKPATNVFTYKTYANLLGGLLVRSMERGERIYRAMICRGFNGYFPLLHHFHFHKRDMAAMFYFLAFLLFLAGIEWLPKSL